MDTLELTYHFIVLLTALLVFSMKFTAPNALLDILVKIIGKVVPLFVIGYAMVQIFKHYGIV